MNNMGVTEYLVGKKDTQKETDTSNFYLQQAYLSAVNTTLDANGMVDLSILDDPKNAEKAGTIAYDSLVATVKKAFKSSTDNTLHIAQLVRAKMGITKSFLTRYFSSGNVSPQSYFKGLQEDEQFNDALNFRRSFPIQYLGTSPEDINKALEYCGITKPEDQAKVRPRVSDPRALAQVVDIFDSNGVIPPKTLEQLLKVA